MNKLLALVVAGAFAVATPRCGDSPKPPATARQGRRAADPRQAANPQQEKMKACNAKAGDKKGDERKAFMKPACPAKPGRRPRARR